MSEESNQHRAPNPGPTFVLCSLALFPVPPGHDHPVRRISRDQDDIRCRVDRGALAGWVSGRAALREPGRPSSRLASPRSG